MYSDPIVEEIHRTREAHCQEFHGDPHQIFVDVKQYEQQPPEKVVNLSAMQEIRPNKAFAGDFEERRGKLVGVPWVWWPPPHAARLHRAQLNTGEQ